MTKMKKEPAKTQAYSIRGQVISGMVLASLLVAGVMGWAARAKLEGAVVVMGEVAVERDLRVVQHRDGGIVGEILVSAGDMVQRGDVLLRLDDTSARTEKAIIHGKIAEFSIRKARLEAERDLQAQFRMPDNVADLEIGQEKLNAILAGEQRIFEGNLASYLSRKEQLQLGIHQIRVEIQGLEARLDAKEDEIRLVSDENDRIVDLSDKQLTVRNAVFSIQRENVRLAGEHGEILSAVGRARSRISELELEILSIEDAARTDAQRELRELEARLTELEERRLVVEDTLARTVIRAPISGYINDLAINSVGGVISPAEILATIMPEDADLVFVGRVPAAQIEQVAIGKKARLRFSAFAQNETPELNGKVHYVSVAATPDTDMPGLSYAIRVNIPAYELDRLEGKELRPGMPLEIYLTTDERTALSYLVKPFSDQVARAFKER